MQTVQNTPTIEALAQLLQLNAGQSDAARAQEAKVLASNRAPYVNAIVPPAADAAPGYVLLLLRGDREAQKIGGFTKSLREIVLFDEAVGDAIKFDLEASLPAFIPARFASDGLAQCRELAAALRSGLLEVAPFGAWRVDPESAEKLGQRAGLIAIGHTKGTLSFALTINEDEMLRVVQFIAAAQPKLADQLERLSRGHMIPVRALVPNHQSDARYGWGQLR